MISLGKLQGTLKGTTLSLADPHPDGKLVLGVLGPINEASGENLFALRRDVAFFAKSQADAIVVTGDVGEVASGIERAVDELAQSGLPVLVVIGNRECRADYNDGVRAAQQKHPNVVDLNAIRAVEFPEATLVSLPGYHDPNYINCDTGCRYTQGTLQDVVTLAEGSKAPVVLVSHGPPRGEGSQAIDYAESGGNVGDPQINQAITAAKIHFGLFSNIKEAGGRATDLAGTTRIPQDTFVDSLFLNPGPAGAEGWRMNDGHTGHGYAALLTVKDGKAAWTVLAAQKLTPAERKQAKALENEAP
jgi:Icc-related predicted phosphoesterase